MWNDEKIVGGLSTNSCKETSAKERLNIMRQNVVQVLLHSTVMPFRWLKSSFRCFYCYDVFQEPKDLKSHNQITHIDNDEEKSKSMRTYWEPTVFVDISNMSCKLCPENMTDFYQLIDHLMFDHDIPFNKDIGICMNPFKLYNISVACVLCDKVYSTFGHLLIHTNRDHKGCSQLLCDVCGQHFRHANNLRDHINKEHGNKVVICTLCGEKINGINRMRTHMQNSHNKKYKCFICTDLFETHYKRSLHMMTVHKNREEVKCQHCPKTFVFRSTMMRHVRERHLQEKNVVCAVCGWKGFGDNRLQDHMMKHSNERNFKCSACDKAFKTKKTMRQHYNNIHEKVLRVVPVPQNSAINKMIS
ncbi:zinc finger Y-chromosomal protein 1-like [Aphomia sociella]